MAYYGTGLDKDPSIAQFHRQVKKQVTQALFSLGKPLEDALAKELGELVVKGEIGLERSRSPVLSFEDYCKVGSIAVKYSLYRVRQEEKGWEDHRRGLIKRKKGAVGEEGWIKAEISNDYAQFIVGQSLAETNYFETATEQCYKALGISTEQAEDMFKQHVLLKPDQRQTYAKLIHSINDELSMQQSQSDRQELTSEETREALTFLAVVRTHSEDLK